MSPAVARTGRTDLCSLAESLLILILSLIDGFEECHGLLEAGLMLLAAVNLSAPSYRGHGLVSESVRVLVG